MQAEVELEFKNYACWATILANVNTKQQNKTNNDTTEANADSTAIMAIDNIEIVSQLTFSYYPNPASTILHLDYVLPENMSAASVQIFDMQGNQIKTVTITKSSTTLPLDISFIKSGIYFIQVSSDSYVLTQQRFMVVR